MSFPANPQKSCDCISAIVVGLDEFGTAVILSVPVPLLLTCVKLRCENNCEAPPRGKSVPFS